MDVFSLPGQTEPGDCARAPPDSAKDVLLFHRPSGGLDILLGHTRSVIHTVPGLPQLEKLREVRNLLGSRSHLANTWQDQDPGSQSSHFQPTDLAPSPPAGAPGVQRPALGAQAGPRKRCGWDVCMGWDGRSGGWSLPLSLAPPSGGRASRRPAWRPAHSLTCPDPQALLKLVPCPPSPPPLHPTSKRLNDGGL